MLYRMLSQSAFSKQINRVTQRKSAFSKMKHLNIVQTAKFLNIHRDTLRSWIKSGKIKPTVVKQSGLPLFSEEDLINLTCKTPTLAEIGYKLDLILKLLEHSIQQDE